MKDKILHITENSIIIDHNFPQPYDSRKPSGTIYEKMEVSPPRMIISIQKNIISQNLNSVLDK